jgi:hypothetical protein
LNRWFSQSIFGFKVHRDHDRHLAWCGAYESIGFDFSKLSSENGHGRDVGTLIIISSKTIRMSYHCHALFIQVFTVVLGLSQLGSCLWPIPRTLQSGTTFLKISPSFDISISTSGCANEPPQDLLDAVSRTKQFIQTDALQRLVPGRGTDDTSKVQSAAVLSNLKLTLSCTNESGFHSLTEEAQAPIDDRKEGYSLTVPADGTAALLSANSTLGLFRGLTTFSQLWYDLANTTYTNVAPVTISNDSPAYVRDSRCGVHVANANSIPSRNTVVLCWIPPETCASNFLSDRTWF